MAMCLNLKSLGPVYKWRLICIILIAIHMVCKGPYNRITVDWFNIEDMEIYIKQN